MDGEYQRKMDKEQLFVVVCVWIAYVDGLQVIKYEEQVMCVGELISSFSIKHILSLAKRKI